MSAILEVSGEKPVQAKIRRFGAHLMAGTAAVILLGGCSTMGNVWDSTTSTVGGWFGSDEQEAAADAAPSGQGAPELSSVPGQAPTPPSAVAPRTGTTEGLVSDRGRAQYTEQGGRREPVNVRPLDETTSTPDAASRINMPAPQRTDVAALAPATPAPMAPPAAAPAPMAPLAPSATLVPAPPQVSYSIADYGSETVVIGGSGPTAPARVPGGFRSLASYTGSNSVSSQVAQVTFASGTAISAADKRALADAARLRADADGVIRVVAYGSDTVAANRAAAVARELQRLGVPAERMYVGTDAASFGGAADVFLDY